MTWAQEAPGPPWTLGLCKLRLAMCWPSQRMISGKWEGRLYTLDPGGYLDKLEVTQDRGHRIQHKAELSVCSSAGHTHFQSVLKTIFLLSTGDIWGAWCNGSCCVGGAPGAPRSSEASESLHWRYQVEFTEPACGLWPCASLNSAVKLKTLPACLLRTPILVVHCQKLQAGVPTPTQFPLKV